MKNFGILTVCLLIVFVFLGCKPTQNDFQYEPFNIKRNVKTESNTGKNDSVEDYQPNIESFNIQLFQNQFDEFAYNLKIISDKEFTSIERNKAFSNLSGLFYQKGLVEYYYKGQIQRSGSRVYFKKVMSTNCKISFANIRHKYDLKNDIPTIIFDAVKLIYQPDTEEKYLISISVEMVNNNSEPMITNITINDMEKCF